MKKLQTSTANVQRKFTFFFKKLENCNALKTLIFGDLKQNDFNYGVADGN